MGCTRRGLKKTAFEPERIGLLGTPLPVPDEQLEEVALSSAGELIIKEDLQQIIPSPAPAQVQLALPREKVNAQFLELLGKGFETCFGGLFLIVSFANQGLAVCPGIMGRFSQRA